MSKRSEDELGTKLDRCVADTILKTGAGLTIGIVSSVVLLRRHMFPVYFFSGIGMGWGVANCQNDLRSPYVLHGKRVAADSLKKTVETSAPTQVMVVDPTMTK